MGTATICEKYNKFEVLDEDLNLLTEYDESLKSYNNKQKQRKNTKIKIQDQTLSKTLSSNNKHGQNLECLGRL